MAIALAEAATRRIDGYRLSRLHLELAPAVRPVNTTKTSLSQKWRGPADALPYVMQLPVASGVDRDWFTSTIPLRILPEPDPELRRRSDRYSGEAQLLANYEWNWNYVLASVCGREHPDRDVLFGTLQDIFVFDSHDRSEFPMFRFLRNAHYPDGLSTNGFGWRSPEITVTKPPKTIRVAFVGASTTGGAHGEPYSYPELVGLWLNRWANAHGIDVRFEAINAGREGINSRSIQAIVRQEVAPVEPDLVVYYEGANQFWPGDFIAVRIGGPPHTMGVRPSAAASYSALARRFDSLVRHATEPGFEPSKPYIVAHWPRDLDERNPNVDSPRLPIQLPVILSDLDNIRTAVDGEGGHVVMTSFKWIVYPGLWLDPVRDAGVFDQLNVMFWPFTYAHMRRFLDFQTRVFRKYAEEHGLDFIDVAGTYPSDPRLFEDAIHMSRAGIHLQAWIVFNGLVPIIERRLASGEWPRQARRELSTHPAFGERRLVTMNDVRAGCTATSH